MGMAGATLCLGALATSSVAVAGTGAVAGTAALSAASAGGQDIPAPDHPLKARRNTGTPSSSDNWAGYGQQEPYPGPHTFTGVTATMVVTTVDTAVSSPRSQYSADWVGIGGFLGSAKLVQAGIEEDNIDGQAFYGAWTEVLPHPEVPLASLAIHPGDVIDVTVRLTAQGKHARSKKWDMTVTDETTGQSAGRDVRYNSAEDSVEAIHERPCLGNPCGQNLATLSTTSNEQFLPAEYTTSAPNVSPVYEPLLSPAPGATLYNISMLNDNGSVVATPSNANAADDGFVVADGSNTPNAP